MLSKGEKTRQHLIHTSAELFNRKGYAGTAISDILEASGYSKGALYRTFDSKEDLSFEAFKYNLRKMQKAIDKNFEAATTPKEKLLAISNFYLDGDLIQLMPGGCPLLNTALEADDTNESLNKLVRKGFDYLRSKLEQALIEGQKSGEFSRELDVRQVAIFSLACIEGGIAMAKTYHNRTYLRKTMLELQNYLNQVIS